MVLPALVASILASASAPSSPQPRDAFLQDSRRVQPRPLPAGLTRLFLAGQVSSWEERLGVPTFFRAPAPAAGELAPRDQGLGAAEAARQHLLRWAPLYGLGGAAAAGAALTRVHDLGQGAVVATFERRVGGVPVFRDRLHVVMNQRLELVALSGYLTPVERQVGSFRLSEPAALGTALADVAGAVVDPAALVVTGVDGAGMSRLAAAPGSGVALGSLARARKVLFGLPGALVPAWYVELSVPGSDASDAAMVAEVVGAADGRVLWKKDLVQAEAYTYRVWADPTPPYLPADNPYGNGLTPLPSATPDPLKPAFVEPQLVTLANLPFSRNDPWLPSGATTTKGNNADAYADLAAPDGFGAGDARPSTTSALTFDRTYNPQASAGPGATQALAGATQLFYTVNLLHDWYYDRGFAEADGNAQEKNFGRGGAEGDPMLAEAQDHGGTDNANMSTPADGESPRMQMFVWDLDSPLLVTALGKTVNAIAGGTGFGPPTFDLTATAALTSPADGCGPISGNLSGQIAIIDRGTCTFETKMTNAQNAGAVGVLIINNVDTINLGAMAGAGELPILLIDKAAGAPIKAAAPTSVRLLRSRGKTRDGDLDATVVSHEWTHYLSNRLIADAAGLNTSQATGLGEGWSDVGALLLMVRAEDAQVPSNAGWAGTYAVGAYAVGSSQPDSVPYFGIRRFPYSTDLARNPLTFRHIADGTALPTTAPAAPGTNLTGSRNSEVHNTGEVWAVMVWECYAALLRSGRLPFEQARERMQTYLVASLKATPTDPTFVEARDALLAVAAATDPRDEVDFQKAFARRGLGLFAVAPPRVSSSNTPVVEDFTEGSELVFAQATLDDSTSSCDHDAILDVGERGRLTVVLRNLGSLVLSATTVTVSTSTPGVTFTPSSTITLGASRPYTLATGSVEVALPPGFAGDHLELQLSWADPGLPASAGRPRSVTVQVPANLDAALGSSASEGAETGLDVWTHLNDTALSPLYDWTSRDVGPRQRAFFGLDAPTNADISLVSPVLHVGAGPLVMTLRHRWAFEVSDDYYDGATIEFSTNGGASWDDLLFPDAGLTSGTLADGGVFAGPDGGAFALPDGGYTGVLNSSSGNPLGGRPAFAGFSSGYPEFVTSVLDLGTAHAGQDLQVRFRVGSDNFVAVIGWDLDQITFSGITNTPFPGFVTNVAKTCTASPVVARVGADLTVDERSLVRLDGTASTGPAGTALVGTWTQTSGPPVVLEGVDGGTLLVSFRAPEVRADTPLGFELQVRGGGLVSAPAPLQVLVHDVNRAPFVSAIATLPADGGTLVTLLAGASDPDGDPVTLSWSQASGPAVTLSSTTAAQVTFPAPSVAQATELGFTVTASDGRASASASVTVPLAAAPSGCGCQAGGAEGLGALASLLALASRARRRRAPAPAGR